MLKTLYIPIDTTLSFEYECPLLIKKYDTLNLKIAVFDKGILKNLTGQTINLILRKSDGTNIEKSITSINLNIATITLDKQATAASGLVEGELQIVDSNGQSTTNTFTYNVSNSLATDIQIKSKDDINTLQDMRALIATYKEEIQALGSSVQATEALINIKNYIDNNLAALTNKNATASANIDSLKTENNRADNNIPNLKNENDNADDKLDKFRLYDPTNLIQQVQDNSASLSENVQEITATKFDNFNGFVAHRGMQLKAPPNTVKSIYEAGKNGYAMVEIDPHLTSDGYWVLIHDDTVDSTTDGTGSVSSMTLAQIQALKTNTVVIDVDEVIRIPTLEEALKECAYWGMGVTIDGSKFTINQANVESILGLLNKYNLTNKSIFMCPLYADRLTVIKYAQSLKVGWVAPITDVDRDIVESANYNNNAVVGYKAGDLTNEVIEKCNKAGVQIYCYLANSVSDAYKWINKGVRFIETDNVIPGGVY